MRKGLWLTWLDGSGSTHVLGSTPDGSEFQAEVKKNPPRWPEKVGFSGFPRPEKRGGGGGGGIPPPAGFFVLKVMEAWSLEFRLTKFTYT